MTAINRNQDENEPECPGCGLPQSLWLPDPEKMTTGYVTKEGDTFCCRDCAEGHVCRCQRANEDVAELASGH